MWNARKVVSWGKRVRRNCNGTNGDNHEDDLHILTESVYGGANDGDPTAIHRAGEKPA